MSTQNRKKQRSLSFPEKSGCIKSKNLSQTADRILSPGERAIFYKSSNNLKVSTVRSENVTSWDHWKICV